MSEHAIDDDDDQGSNGTALSDDDIRGMLAKREQENAKLQRQLDSERQTRVKAERQVHSATQSRWEAEEQAVAARLETADTAALSLRNDYSVAMAEGRFDDAGAAQDKLIEIRARQVADRQYAEFLRAEKAKQPEPQVEQTGADLASYSPAQQRWIQANPAYLTDRDFQARVIRGHHQAMADGIAIDSAEYFATVDRVANNRRQQRQPEPEADVAPEPVPDMPVTRRSEGSQPRRPRDVKLTADQMEAADMSNPDIPVQGHYDQHNNWIPGRYERYVLNREALKRQGRL